MNNKIYVLAVSYEEARHFAYKLGFHYSNMINVDRLEKLKGLSNETLHVTENAKYRKDFNRLIEEAKTRINLEIKYHD